MATPERSDPNWPRRLVFSVVAVVVVLVAGLAASATIPRWWAQRIGDQVEGSLVTGTFVGLFYGFVFTLLPLLVMAAVLRWRRTWKALVIALVVAIVLALPNLMTLGIVIGRGNAAHAGDRILDVEAPAFRGGTLVGVLLAAGLVALVIYLVKSRDRARGKTT
jgi:glucan phosphoethanolaminetransferase (alkaline phosphatase superfamily)